MTEESELEEMYERVIDKMVADGKAVKINIGGKQGVRLIKKPTRTLSCGCVSDGSFICKEHQVK